MPLYAEIINPDTNKVHFRCRVNAGKKCKQCKRTCKLDKNYCNDHVWCHYRVVISKSRIFFNGKSIGLGLFAYSKRGPGKRLKAKFSNRNYKPTDEEKDKYLIFKKGDKIGKYEAERISKRELDERYDIGGKEYTAPYGAEDGAGNLYDSLCVRNFISYANDPKGSKYSENAKLRDDLFLVATRNIYTGDEILWSYGDYYWNGPQAKIRIINSTKERECKKVDRNCNCGCKDI